MLKVNKVRCKLCGDIIESKYRHDFVTCKCGKVSVDGGLDYIRRCAPDRSSFEELSEYDEDDKYDDVVIDDDWD